MNKTIFDSGSNPVFSFISPPETQSIVIEDKGNPENSTYSSRIDKKVTEKIKLSGIKTKRLNLLIQPQLHETLAKIACMKQTSVNAVIIQAAKEFCSKEARALEKYERTFGGEAEEV